VKNVNPPAAGARPQTPFEAGRDAALTKPNDTNCHFLWFVNADRTREWERGFQAGKEATLPPQGGLKGNL
jgi:hypothetical protein